MGKIDFSIIIPTFNRKEILKETLRRIFEQDFDRTKYEVVVIDDGSSDGTCEFLKTLKSPINFRFAGFTMSKGRAKARNAAIRMANGKYILMLDDDVWVDNSFIKMHFSTHRLFDKDVVVLGDYPPALNIPQTVWNLYLFQHHFKISEGLKQNATNLPYYLLRTGNISLKREVLEKVGLFDENFNVYGGEDTDLGYRLKKQGYKLVYREIMGWHYFNADLRSILNKAYQRGSSACLLVKKYPELWKDMQFHSIFYNNSPLWKNVLKFLLYLKIVINLNKILVQLLSRLKFTKGIVLKYLLGILEWQYYALGVKEYGKSIRP